MRVSICWAAALVMAMAVGCSRREAGEPGAAPSASVVMTLNDSSFDSAIRSGVVLVDFWASWCGPCRMQAPVVEQVATQVQGKARVAKLDVDAAPQTAKKFNIRSIPTIIVFKDGAPKKQFIGVTKAETLLSAVNSVLETE